MSKGTRSKRKSRPWQNADAMRDIADILGPARNVDPDYFLEGYEVQQVPAYRAERDYLCPDCGNTVPEGEAHVVVFPTGDPDLRRHWHQYCWRAEVRRSTGAGY